MSTITWVEDAPHYVQDIVDELTSMGNHVDLFVDANSLLQQLRQVAQTTDLVILDLWVPAGRGDNIPPELCKKGQNTERGLWLYRQVRNAVSAAKREVCIIVLSGNLDLDTQKELLEAGIEKKHMYKKPVEFDSFVSAADELAKTASKSSRPKD